MKIIPDPAYDRIRLELFRIVHGLDRMLPFVTTKIPKSRILQKYGGFTTTAILMTTGVAVFYVPALMFPVVVAWGITSWVLGGSCEHCAASRSERNHREEEGE